MKSGTSTLQAAVIGTPMILLPRVVARGRACWPGLIRVPWIGLANLVAGEGRRNPIHDEATGERLVVEIERLLGDRTA
ncbi:MAG: hypothetical protein U0231_14410 [Nitrospiraceae bacterium]